MSEQWILPGLPSEQAKVELPVGGETFVPTGFIGQWTATLAERIYADGLTEDDAKDLRRNKSVFVVNTTTNGGFIYLNPRDEHKDVRKEIMGQFGADWSMSVWHFEAYKDRLFWFSDEAKDKFKWEPIGGDVQVSTLRSYKHRHEFQLMALPSAVAAVARFFGQDEQYSLDEFVRDTLYDDAFFEEMCGDPDGRAKDLKAFEKDLDEQISKGVPFEAALNSARSTLSTPIEYSVLGQRRKALWAALGEEDWTKYTVGQGKPKTDTESPKLAGALAIVQPWTEARWCRVRLVPNPKPDALRDKEDDNTRMTIPVIVDLYHDEAEARAAFEALRAQSEDEGGLPPLPASWTGVPNAVEAFRENLVSLWGKPEAVVTSKLGCTAEELQSWAEALDLK